MNHNYCAEYKNIKLRPLGNSDIEKLRIWRNDAEATKFLRPVGQITEEMQQNWFNSYIKDIEQIIFAIEETDTLKRMVGSLALYDIDKKNKTCEIGKIQIGDPDAHGKGIGRYSLVAAMKIAFELIGISTIVGEVHRDNIQARTNDLKIGFKIVGEQKSVVGGIEDLLEIKPEDAKQVNSYYDQIKIYER